jgi:DNA-binding transcriptional MocR family regulator
MPGPFSDVDHRNTHAFRLSYGSLAPEAIAEGIDLLADAVSDLLARPPENRGLSALGDLF